VRRHLSGCSGCSTALAELNATRALAREAFEALPAQQSADSMWEDVARRLPTTETAPEIAATTVVSQRPRGWRLALVPAAVVAAALLVFFAITTDDGDDAPIEVAVVQTNADLPPVVEKIDGPGTKIMNFKTDNPGVTIAWIIEPDSDDQ
jgi:anti-sigma-K factor RskA